MNRECTPEQMAALRRFAANHGRTWKAQLLTLWANGRDTREMDAGLLRQVRNTLGPMGLTSLRLEAKQ